MFAPRLGALASSGIVSPVVLPYEPDAFIDDVVFLADTWAPTDARVYAQNKLGNLNIELYNGTGASSLLAAKTGLATPSIPQLSRVFGGESTALTTGAYFFGARRFAQEFSEAGEWTIEFRGYFARVDTVLGTTRLLNSDAAPTAYKGLKVTVTHSTTDPGTVNLTMSSDGVNDDLTATFPIPSISALVEYEITLTKDNSGNVRAYWDGVQIGTNASFASAVNPTVALADAGRIEVGANYGSSVLRFPFCSLRITQACRYTGASYTLPTRPHQGHVEGGGDPLLYRTFGLLQTTRQDDYKEKLDWGFGSSNLGILRSASSVEEGGTNAVNTYQPPRTAAAGYTGQFFNQAPYASLAIRSYTLEAYFTANARTSGHLLNVGRTSTGFTGGLGIIYAVGTLQLEVYSTTNTVTAGSTVITLVNGQRYHLAVTREGNVYTMFLDGNPLITVNTAGGGNWNTTTTEVPFWGRGSSNGTYDAVLEGVRLTLGNRYPVAFTPPSLPLPQKQQGYIDWATLPFGDYIN